MNEKPNTSPRAVTAETSSTAHRSVPSDHGHGVTAAAAVTADTTDSADASGDSEMSVSADTSEGADARRLAETSRRAVWGWRSNLDQLMPVLLFLAFFNLDGLRIGWLSNIEVAIIAATGWSVKAAYSRRRRGLPIGAWLPVITGYLLVRAAVSIAVERELVDFGVSTEAVYFGIGIGTKMLVGVAAAVTVVAGKPFMLWVARRFVPLAETVLRDRGFVATMRNVTLVIVAYEIGSSVWDIWLYNNAGVNLFLLTRQVVNFVVAFLLIFVTLLYIDRRISKIDGCPNLTDLVGSLTRRDPAPTS